jgi:uncharacterized delta-60 repeat protein
MTSRTGLTWLFALVCAAGCGGGGGGGGGGVDGGDGGDGGGAQPGCGDGIVEAGEDCDDGAANSDTAPNACRTSCDAAACGDGVIDDGESCDDGDANSDTAPDACRRSCQPASCGDGVVDTGEGCDDGDSIDSNACANDCTTPVIWTESLEGPIASGVAVDSAGNVLVSGYVYGPASVDAWVRKYDPSGGTVWTQTYDGAAGGDDAAYGVAVDPAGNVLVAGYETTVLGDYDVWVGKYDPDGGTLWTQTYDGAAGGDDEGIRIAVDTSGNALVAGYETTALGDHDVWVRKYDPSGGTLWTQTYDDTSGGDDSGLGIAVDADANVLVTGYETNASGSEDAWLRKYDPDGGTIWTRTYAGAEDLFAAETGVATDAGGNVLVTGFEYTTVGTFDIFVRKYDPDGASLWTQTYDGPGHDLDWTNDITADVDGSVIATGSQTAMSGGTSDVWTAKYGPYGTPVWTRTYNGAGNDYDQGWGVRTDAAGNVLVVGDETLSSGNLALWLTKYLP